MSNFPDVSETEVDGGELETLPKVPCTVAPVSVTDRLSVPEPFRGPGETGRTQTGSVYILPLCSLERTVV